MTREPVSRSAHGLTRSERVLKAAWRLVVQTVGTCYRNRVTGLAAEAAFFALLSLPPLIFALVGSIGYVFESSSDSRAAEIEAVVVEASSRVLTEDTVRTIIQPTLSDVFRGGRYDVISIGFVLALWSGSRALNVFVDTITIMYDLGGQRGIVRTRVLSFVLYVLGLLIGILSIPLVVAGPSLVEALVPARFELLNDLYWPSVVVLSICFLATLYHASVPVRTSWRHNLPGATLTLLLWVVGSFLLRWVLTATAGQSTSIYGPLAAPIAVLLWLYLLSIAVLIGAAVNASFDRIWPEYSTAQARRELVSRLRIRTVLPRLRGDAGRADAGEDAGEHPGRRQPEMPVNPGAAERADPTGREVPAGPEERGMREGPEVPEEPGMREEHEAARRGSRLPVASARRTKQAD